MKYQAFHCNNILVRGGTTVKFSVDLAGYRYNMPKIDWKEQYASLESTMGRVLFVIH